MRGVAVPGGFRLDAAASCRCLNPHLGHCLAAPRRSVVAFRQAKGVGSHDETRFRGSVTRPVHSLPTPSDLPSRYSQSSGRPRLASSWWSTLAGWDWIPTGFRVKFQRSLPRILLTQALPGAMAFLAAQALHRFPLSSLPDSAHVRTSGAPPSPGWDSEALP
jgi:hypothetical protein